MDTAAARSTDPATSHDAARSVDVTACRGQILDALSAHPDGLTDHELDSMFPRWQPKSAGKRRSELTRLGYVIDTGRRVVGGNGRRRIVWAVTGKGAWVAQRIRSQPGFAQQWVDPGPDRRRQLIAENDLLSTHCRMWVASCRFVAVSRVGLIRHLQAVHGLQPAYPKGDTR